MRQQIDRRVDRDETPENDGGGGKNEQISADIDTVRSDRELIAFYMGHTGKQNLQHKQSDTSSLHPRRQPSGSKCHHERIDFGYRTVGSPLG